jgi:hypothetical protein
LIVTEMTSNDGIHSIVVKNIGGVAAPATVLRVDFCRPTDGAVVASAKATVPSLEVNQSVRVNVRQTAISPLQAIAYADAALAVAEKDETNNIRAILVPGKAPLPLLPQINVEAETLATPAS